MRTFEIVGHRGARNEAPENTLPGFAHAVALGLNAIELDVHLSRDGNLVVIHDGTVNRTTDAEGPVGSFTAAELAALDARAVFPHWPERIGVPTLDQVLDLLGDMPVIQIEIKKDTVERMEQVADALLASIRRRDLGSRVIVSSFERRAVAAVGAIDAEQARAFIGRYDSVADLETALELGCTQADISLDHGSADMVLRAHDAGLRVVGYQCNSSEALAKCLDWEVDAATSDVPSTILPLLRQRQMAG